MTKWMVPEWTGNTEGCLQQKDNGVNLTKFSK